MADHLALDIETVPAADITEYSEAIQEKIQKKIARNQERNPDYDYNLFAATHGDFGKIICISMGYINGDRIKLKSLYGNDEHKILSEFNDVCKSIRGIYIHYNGLNFDIPFILQRMAHHNIKPGSDRLTNLRKFWKEPHFDIMQIYYNWNMQNVMSLGVLSELHGIPSPKGDLSGDKVHEAFRNGEWGRIVRYCEFDVGTTLNLYNKIYRYEPVMSVDQYDFSGEGEG